jgi:hypothetical protein
MAENARGASAEAEHWRRVYENRAVADLSWFEPDATASLQMIESLGLQRDVAVLDVGAGSSTLVDGLLQRGFRDVTLLDVTDAAFVGVRARIGPRSEVAYVVADVTAWKPPRRFGLWHDRAVFHFMVTVEQRAGYRRTLGAALEAAGFAVIATFAPEGPERCSGLPVCRYSADGLAEALGPTLELLDARREVHITPRGVSQAFIFAAFARTR